MLRLFLAYWVLTVGYVLLRYSVVSMVESFIFDLSPFCILIYMN